MFKKLLHGKRKSALLNLTWSGLLCRVVWSVSQLLYLLQRAGHFKFFSPSFFVGLELNIVSNKRTVIPRDHLQGVESGQSNLKAIPTELVMPISRQLTNRILYDARTIRKESLELR